MNNQEMYNWLCVYDKQVEVHTPNEIFEKLSTMTSEGELKSWKHKCFAYSYYCLINYIYRNTLYSNMNDDYSQERIVGSIYSGLNMVSYITKKNGVLEKNNLIKSLTNNYPISTAYTEDNILEFYYYEDIKNESDDTVVKTGHNFTCKVPIRSLYNEDGEYYTGTYYHKDNTHLITIQQYIDIITNINLGYVGVYLFGYLKMMCDKFPDGYIISNKNLSRVLGCSEKTLMKYTKELENKGFIHSRRGMIQGHKLMEKEYYFK